MLVNSTYNKNFEDDAVLLGELLGYNPVPLVSRPAPVVSTVTPRNVPGYSTPSIVPTGVTIRPGLPAGGIFANVNSNGIASVANLVSNLLNKPKTVPGYSVASSTPNGYVVKPGLPAGGIKVQNTPFVSASIAKFIGVSTGPQLPGIPKLPGQSQFSNSPLMKNPVLPGGQNSITASWNGSGFQTGMSGGMPVKSNPIFKPTNDKLSAIQTCAVTSLNYGENRKAIDGKWKYEISNWYNSNDADCRKFAVWFDMNNPEFDPSIGCDAVSILDGMATFAIQNGATPIKEGNGGNIIDDSLNWLKNLLPNWDWTTWALVGGGALILLILLFKGGKAAAGGGFNFIPVFGGGRR